MSFEGIKSFVIPPEMRALRYLFAYTAHDLERMKEEEGYCARLRQQGYDVEGFCVSVPGPGHPHWPFDILDREYYRGNPDLLKTYARLEERLRGKDVFVLWTGANVHPDLVARLSTYNVYVCSDDPEASAYISRPVAPCFDFAFTRNIACVDMYRGWGCRHVKWLSAAMARDFCDTTLTEESILNGDRDIDVVLFCERVSGFGKRNDRVDQLVRAFPQVHARGRGWPGGYVPLSEKIDAYRRAKIGWNIHLSVGPNNSRLMALPAFGILQVCDNKETLGKIFRLDREVAGFDTIEECIDKTRYYLAHDRERREIAAGGWKRVTTDYTEERQWERLVSSIAQDFLRKRGGSEVAARPEAGRPGAHEEVLYAGSGIIRLNLGCGAEYLDGYVNVDRNPGVRTDLRADLMEIGRHFAPDSVEEIRMIHSINYLNLWQARDFLRTAWTLLVPGGRLVIETPNLEKAIAKIRESAGDFVGHLEGVRALHAFGMDQIANRELFTPYAFSWTPGHFTRELEDAGFKDVRLLPPETHVGWRDMRVEAIRGVVAMPIHADEITTGGSVGPTPSAGVGMYPPRVLILADSVLGHVTSHSRGRVFVEPLRESGWEVEYLDVRQADLGQVMSAASRADLVYLLKVASLDLVLRIRSCTRARIIFDLTDALWKTFHRANGWTDLERILANVDAVFSDNERVMGFGRKHNGNVLLVPSCTRVERFDEERCRDSRDRGDGRTVIGWVGSGGTVGALAKVRIPLERLFLRHLELELRVLGACAEDLPDMAGIRASFLPKYDEDTMIREVLAMDIGIFPPPLDTEDYEVRGAFKAQIYMTGGVPAVCQNAGDCKTLIEDGVNGMLAETEEEWESKIEALVSSVELRREIGRRGLETVRERYSQKRVCARLKEAFLEVAAASLRGEPRGDISRTMEGKPIRVLMYYDVEGWAWWYRINEVSRRMPRDIEIRSAKLGEPFRHEEHDLVVVLDPYLYDTVRHVPREKLVVGCSCPKYVDQSALLAEHASSLGLLVNSREMSDKLRGYENVFCCPNGVDLDLFHPVEGEDPGPVACWVGNSDSDGNKGLSLIQEACRNAGYRLLTLDREARRDGATLLSRERVRDEIYRKASVYVCASEYEGTPNPALEALACGLPVISTRVGNMPEIIRDGENGFLVDRDEEAIASALRRFAEVDRGRMRQNARASVERGWGWDRQAHRYEEMFRALAAGSRRKDFARLVNRAGERRLSEGNVESSAAMFMEAARIDPEYSSAYNNLGVSAWLLGDAQTALSHLNRALTLNPREREAVLNVATVFAETGHRDMARKICAAYLVAVPGDADISARISELEEPACG